MEKVLLPIFMLMLILTSCKKEELSFVIEGNVNDGTLNTVLSNAKVSIFTFPVGGTIGTKVTTLTTDSQGGFNYDLERKKYEKIELVVSKNNYFNHVDEVPFSELTTDGKNIFTYELKAKSWTKFILYNQQPAAQSDELKILKDSGKEGCSECCANGYYYYNGVVDTVVYCPNDGNHYMKFYYWVNGNELNGVDSVYNTPFDTTTYELYY